MRKVLGKVLSTKPVPLSRASKLISRFAAVDNGASPAVSLYLERAAAAFNHLVQFHKKPSLNADVGNRPEGEKGRDPETKRKSDAVNSADEARTVASGEEKKSKKKKRKSDTADSGEKRNGKKRRAEGFDS